MLDRAPGGVAVTADEYRIVQGAVVRCDDCQYARPIETPVLELFGYRVGFGPGGASDIFLERDVDVQCYRCADADLTRFVDGDGGRDGGE